MKELRRLFRNDGSRQLIAIYYDNGKMIMWRDANDNDVVFYCGIIARIDEEDLYGVYYQKGNQ